MVLACPADGAAICQGAVMSCCRAAGFADELAQRAGDASLLPCLYLILASAADGAAIGQSAVVRCRRATGIADELAQRARDARSRAVTRLRPPPSAAHAADQRGRGIALPRLAFGAGGSRRCGQGVCVRACAAGRAG